MYQAAASSAIRILVADDSDGQRRFCRVVLETAAIDVSEAANGQIALDMLKAETFDILVLDLKMPVLDGIEVLRRLPQTPMPGGAPLIIVCSSEANESMAKHRGAFEQVGYILQKPTEPADLLNAVSLLLGTRPQPRGLCG